MDLNLYNTLSRSVEVFEPLHPSQAGVYSCGPTVYGYAHIGNLRAYLFADVLRRTLLLNGFDVKLAMNITDVGHLTSNADDGEDKVEAAAKQQGKTIAEITAFYTDVFKQDLKHLNIIEPTTWMRATECIPEQIALAQKLETKGFAYRTSDGLYFDTGKLSDYGKLARLNTEQLKEGARVEKNPEKKNPTDFALWKISKPGEKRLQEWDSPWGKGFPGWHLECSVMSTKILGQPFDIHTGGIDHIPVHHTNEIAQSEAAEGKPLANVWMHNEFVTVKDGRMGKSEGNFITLADVIAKGYDPLAYRYFVLQAHYRTPIDFSFEALDAAQNALNNLRQRVEILSKNEPAPHPKEQEVHAAFNDDLNTPRALALLWEMPETDDPAEQYGLCLFADRVLGLGLDAIHGDVPAKVTDLVTQRETARKEGRFEDADTLRTKIEAAGFIVDDTPKGPHIYSKR
ncbi:MAG: cysteine--tRNA ligase [bacterium]|nr:cysteine--tRNA ligase [bacterium]